jgi:hypothetical protein
MMENGQLFFLIRMLVVPGVVMGIGLTAALRFALAGRQKQRLIAAVVVMCLAASAAVSICAVPTEQTRLKPGNPYPLGIGGVVVEHDTSGSLIDLFTR